MEHYKKLEEIFTGLQSDFEKFYENNNKAAGLRIRKSMQELKKIAQDVRIDVLNRKKELDETKDTK